MPERDMRTPCGRVPARRAVVPLTTLAAMTILTALGLALGLAGTVRAQQATPGNIPPIAQPPSPEEVEQSRRAVEAARAGETLLRQKKWDAAIAKFHEAQALDPYFGLVFYGLARAYAGKGQLQESVANFRLLYGVQVDAQGNKHSHIVSEPTASMDYALVLSRLGRADEAAAVYNHAANLLNYQDAASTGKPYLKVLLPMFGSGSGQISYTPQRLQAMAHAAQGIASGDEKEEEADLLEAIRLWPDSPVPYFYLGEQMSSAHWDEARAAYSKAIQLGSGPTITAARDALKQLPNSHDYAPASAAVRQTLGLAPSRGEGRPGSRKKRAGAFARALLVGT